MDIKLFVLLALCCYEASALKCYTCLGVEEHCQDPFDKKNITTQVAPSGYVCTKLKSKDVVLSRGALPEEVAKAYKPGKDIDLTTCKKDLCNSAPQLATSAALILSVGYALFNV